MYLWGYRLALVVFLAVSAPILLPDRFLPLSWHSALVVALVLLWPFCRMLDQFSPEKVRYRQTVLPTTWPMYLLVCWLPVTLWSSVDPHTSWIVLGYLFLGITFYSTIIPCLPLIVGSRGLANHSCAESAAIFAGTLLIGSGTLLAISFPFIVIWKPQFRLFYLPIYDYLQSWQRNMGETVHPNILAGALVVTIPVTVTAIYWVSKQCRREKGGPFRTPLDWFGIGLVMLLLVSMLLQFSAITLSQSRGSYLAVASALVVMAALRWSRLIYVLPILVLVAVVGIRISGLHLILDQFSSDGSLGGWAGRLEIWQTSLMAVADFPFTGIGIGTFTTVIPLLYPLTFPIESYPHAHNLLLQIGVDLGIPGLVAYLALLLNLSAMLIVSLRRTVRHTMVHSLAIGATGSMVGMLVHGILDAVMWGTKVSFLSWLLFALITQLFLAVSVQQSNKPLTA